MPIVPYTPSGGGYTRYSGGDTTAFIKSGTTPSSSYSTSSTSIGPSRLTARTDKDAAAGALGNPLAAVVGTGRVDGMYFIGGTDTVDTRTEIKTTQSFPPVGWVIAVNNDPNTASDIAAQMTLFSTKTVTTETNITTAVTTKAGYILAYDYFERGYDLIRLEVDGQVVFDAESADRTFTDASVEFRFYGGQHTSVDPIVAQIIGALPGAYKNMVMIFLDGFPAQSPPSVSAVISNAADDGPESVTINWTSTPPVTIYGTTSGTNLAYDPGRGVLYQTLGYLELPGTGVNYLAALDMATHTELYRVPLAGSEPYADHTDRTWVWSIRGTDYVVIRLADGALPTIDAIYNVLTGEVVASHSTTSGDFLNWEVGLPFGPNQWLMAGPSAIAVFDHTGATITFFPRSTPDGSTYGRVQDDSTSFFQVSGNDIYETEFNGSGISSRLVYTAALDAQGVWFDPGTNYLVVSVYNGGSPRIQYVDPDSGELIDSFGTTYAYTNFQSALQVGGDRFFARPGFLLITPEIQTDPGEVHVLNVAEQTVRVYAESESVEITNVEFTTAIFDQAHLLYVAGFNTPGATTTMPNAQNYVIHYLPSALPGLIDLEDAVTDIMYMAGFSPADLTFSGFGGLSTYGFVIASDSNIQTSVRTLSDIYDFYWCDTGYGFYFKKPGTDLGFTVDAAITTDDIVERDDPVMSKDEGDVRTPSSVELEYISKDGAYKVRPASFSMTTGVLNSITTPRMSTPVLFDDLEAQRLVTEKFFQYQENRRTHSLMVVPENLTLLPGDIVTFPSGLASYTAVVDNLAIDLRTMGVEIEARDFATEVTTTITAVSNDPGTSTLLRFATLYLHLDIPLLNYGHELNGTGLVQYGLLAARLVTWTGGALYRGAFPSPLSLLFDQAMHSSVVALAQDVLGTPADPFGTDDNSTVTIRIVSGNANLLVDATEAEVLAGANLALIGKSGRWELVGYTTVTNNGDESYTLSGFVRRGFHGSEVWADDHAVGDFFVFPLTYVKKVAHPTTDLGDTFYYRAAGFGQDVNLVATETHIIPGVAETPYAVRNVQISNGGSPGGVSIFWDYRSRVADGLNPTDYGEASLAFEVDVYDGATIVRTLTTTTSSVEYSDAQILSDFGGYPDSLTIRVYMMSELDIVVPGQTPVVPGRGYAAPFTGILTTPAFFTADSTVLTADRTDYTADRVS